MRVIAIVFLLSFLLPGCVKQVPPVSNFKVEEVTYARAAIFEADTWDVLDSSGNYTSSVLDSIELNVDDARAAVATLLAGSNYTLPDYSSAPDGKSVSYSIMCHTPHFLLLAYDADGYQTNLFTICFTCGNVRMTNYRKYPKSDELVMSWEGEEAFMKLQDELFPAYKGTFFGDPLRSLDHEREQ